MFIGFVFDIIVKMGSKIEVCKVMEVVGVFVVFGVFEFFGDI